MGSDQAEVENQTDAKEAVEIGDILKAVLDLESKFNTRLEELEKPKPVSVAVQVPKRSGRGRQGPQAVLDTKTGITYRAKYLAGYAVCQEYGLEPSNWVWYAIIAKDPSRFKEI